MTDKTRVKCTIYLVITGIVLSYLSYGVKKLGVGELYPFADWRLYSAPVGINEPAYTYRIYTLDERTNTWVRQPLRDTPAYTRKDYLYVLAFWIRRVLENPEAVADRERLETAVISLEPDASSYRIVKETFFSLPLYADSTRFDTSTVAHFNR